MWKKIILGLIIGTIMLTASAGGIYAYQKNINPSDNLRTQSKINDANKERNCKEMHYEYNNQYQTQNNYCYQQKNENKYNNEYFNKNNNRNCLQNIK